MIELNCWCICTFNSAGLAKAKLTSASFMLIKWSPSAASLAEEGKLRNSYTLLPPICAHELIANKAFAKLKRKVFFKYFILFSLPMDVKQIALDTTFSIYPQSLDILNHQNNTINLLLPLRKNHY